MPEEENRRRCIIDPGSCGIGTTRQQALAEEMAIGADRGIEEWDVYIKPATHLLKHFDLVRKGDEDRPGFDPKGGA